MVKLVAMVPCHTPLYTLISMYLWGGFVSSQCFFPDGSPTSDLQDGYYPCNSTTAGQASSCCQLSTSTCTTTGLCIGNNAYAYRGACTDPKFPEPCAYYCLDVSTFLFSTIFPCGRPGAVSYAYCCANASLTPPYGSLDCCNEAFRGINFGDPFVPLSHVEAHEAASSSTTSSSSTSSSSSASSSSSTPSSSSASTTIRNSTTTSLTSASPATPSPIKQSSSSSSSHYKAVGAGIGLPLGVALFLGLGYLFYRERKQRLKLESLVRDNLPHEKYHKPPQAGAMNSMPYELGGDYGRELDSNPIYEANETN